MLSSLYNRNSHCGDTTILLSFNLHNGISYIVKWHIHIELEQLECLCSEDTPPPHDYTYYWVILDLKSKENKVKVTNLKNLPKFQICHFSNKLYTRHTFWNCLLRCANIKWIWRVLLKIQSRHNSIHRWTDWQGETSISSFQIRWSGRYDDDPAGCPWQVLPWIYNVYTVSCMQHSCCMQYTVQTLEIHSVIVSVVWFGFIYSISWTPGIYWVNFTHRSLTGIRSVTWLV